MDGTKIAANASRYANRTGDSLQAEADRIVAEAGQVDADEDALFGDARGDELPKQWRAKDRKSRIAAALVQLRVAAEQAEQAEQASRAAANAKAAEYERRVRAGETVKGPVPRTADPLVVLRARRARAQKRYEEATDSQRRGQAVFQIRRTDKALAEAQAQADAHARHAGARPEDGGVQTGNHTETTSDSRANAPATGDRSTPTRKANTTDADSRIMKTQQGWTQGYNAQMVVSEDHLILAAWLTQHPTDVLCLIPMMTAAVAAAEAVHAEHPQGGDHAADGIGIMLADAGYLSEANLTAADPDRLIAVGMRSDLKQAAAADPATGPPPEDARPAEAMSHRLRTPEGVGLYKRRGATVEPINGHLKDQVGLRRFARRGLSAAAGSELQLAAAAVNLLKLHRRTSAVPA